MKKVIFIFGCQRSGTTALLKSLGSLSNIRAFPEAHSPLCSRDKNQGLKLNPLAEVNDIIEKVKEDIVIVKPLVQSHIADKIIKFFPGCSSIWMFRNYVDVVASMMVRWPKISRDTHLLPLFTDNRTSNMGYKDAYPNYIVHLAKDLYESNPTVEEVCAMFWMARNSLLFKQNLSERKSVYSVGYEDFVTSSSMSEAFLSRIGIKIPEGFIQNNFNSKSLGKGSYTADKIRISLRDQLDDMYQSLSKYSSLGAD